MKQIIVLQIETPCSNSKFFNNALKATSHVQGVESIGRDAVQKNVVVVTGECIDLVKLVSQFRKKVGCTDVVSVNPIYD